MLTDLPMGQIHGGIRSAIHFYQAILLVLPLIGLELIPACRFRQKRKWIDCCRPTTDMSNQFDHSKLKSRCTELKREGVSVLSGSIVNSLVLAFCLLTV